MRHLKEGDSQDIPLSGKKNYFWSMDHWNSSFQLKAIYNWSFEIARGNGILRLGWMMWTSLLKTTQWMIFAYHRKWMGPIVSPLLKMILNNNYWGAGWEQNANVGNDSGNWGRTQQQRVNSLFEKIIALPRKLRASQLVSMITPSALCVLSRTWAFP